MRLWNVIFSLGPYARITTAVVPFALSMLLRFFLGRNKLTSWLMSLSTMWFLVNVLLAPYSQGMRDDVQSIGSMFHR